MKTSKPHFFIQQCKVDESAENVWNMLTKKSFYQRFLPPWIQIEIIRSPHDISIGSQCHFRINSGPLKGDWSAETIELKPGFLVGFKIHSDRGQPWTVWIKCLPTDDKGLCILEDRFEFPGKVSIGSYQKRIEHTLKGIVYYKNQTLKNDLRQIKRIKIQRKNVLIAGGSGLIGSNLSRFLKNVGYDVDILSTNEDFGSAFWDPSKGLINPNILEKRDVIINLCGAPIACRWNKKNRLRITNSRIKSAHLLNKTISRLDHPPSVYLQASAVGFYGYDNQSNVDETTPRGDGFLANLCEAWENETRQLKNCSTRVVIPRLSIVLTPEGGALAKMISMFKIGASGRLGNGKQFFPWISMNDLSYLFLNLIENDRYTGPINASTQDPIDQTQLTVALRNALGKQPTPPVPAFVLKTIYGAMAEEALLGGVATVSPITADIGFEYCDNELSNYLDLVIPKQGRPKKHI